MLYRWQRPHARPFLSTDFQASQRPRPRPRASSASSDASIARPPRPILEFPAPVGSPAIGGSTGEGGHEVLDRSGAGKFPELIVPGLMIPVAPCSSLHGSLHGTSPIVGARVLS